MMMTARLDYFDLRMMISVLGRWLRRCRICPLYYNIWSLMSSLFEAVCRWRFSEISIKVL